MYTSDYFEHRIDRRGTASEKWDRYAGQEVIPLWVADMDFRSPREVISALHQRVDHGVFGYTSAPEELIEVLIAHLLAEYDWQVEREWLVWLPGLVCGLNVACRAVGRAGDGVVAFTPAYPPFLTAPALAERHLVAVPLVCRDGIWRMDAELLERSLTPHTRLLLLCHPHNPVGRSWTSDELEAIVQVAEQHDLVICSDEIHAGLILDQQRRHLPLARLSPAAARRIITLHAPSKTFNIPGLGCSFAVISDEALRHSFKRTMAGIVPHVNLLGYTAALASYRHGEPWRKVLLEYLRGNRHLVQEAIATMPGLSTWHVEATYLAWIDARSVPADNPGRLFEAGGVGMSDGAPFGAPGFLRLNFGCPRPLLVEALQRMHRVTEHFRTEGKEM